jgi:hypothetical protein
VRLQLLVVALAVATAGVARADDPLAALLSHTDAIAREVSRVRGLPLKRAVPNDVVDRDELRARLVKAAADRKSADAIAADGLDLARWGMIPLATSYADLLVDLMTEQIAGYYDTDTKKLTISKSAGDDPAWAEMVLAHELDHALQDQRFDLHKFGDLPASEGDAAAAREALVEGDGIVLMIEWQLARAGKPAPWGDPRIAAELAREIAAGDGDKLDNTPLAVREAMLFPYRAGFTFVAALRRRNGWSAVDKAFARPPRSTAQILHVDKYLADDKPIPVAAAAPAALAGYTIAASTVWGELGFDLFARAHGVGELPAREAAAGWGGDRVIVLTRAGDPAPEHAVGLARFEWDTEIDAIEAQDAAVRATADQVAGTVLEQDATHVHWLAIDGTQAWVERRGASLVMAIGVPTWAADALVGEAWTAMRVKH